MALTPEQIDNLNPGQTITFKVAAEPTNEGARKTIARLMRRDPDNNRGLRKAQQLRQKRMHSYIRGNRLFYSREVPARVVQPRLGHEWTMKFTPELGPDIKSVSRFVDLTQS